MFPFMMMSGCLFGFGLVAQKAACMDYLIQKIMSINVNPYLTAWLSVCLIAALCADGISGMTMWLGTFGAQFAAMPGVDPGALHRILVASSTTFTDAGTGYGCIQNRLQGILQIQFRADGIIPGYFLTGRCGHRDYLLLKKEAA